MNLWDNLPCELQTYILRLRLASSLQKNWRRHPAIRSICLAKWLTDRHNVSPPLLLYAETAWALEYCAAHSGMGDPVFWTKFCILMLHEIILEEYSSDMGHETVVQGCRLTACTACWTADCKDDYAGEGSTKFDLVMHLWLLSCLQRLL